MAEKLTLMEEEDLENKDPEPPEKSGDSEKLPEFCLCLKCYEKFRLWELLSPEEEEECAEMKSLKAERKSYEELEKSYEEMKQLCEDQAAQCEQQVQEEFRRLHSFLQEQEEKILEDLREERVTKTKNISLELKQVKEKLKDLNKSIEELTGHLQNQPESPHLQPKAAADLDQTPCPRPKADLDQTPCSQPKAAADLADLDQTPCPQPKAAPDLNQTPYVRPKVAVRAVKETPRLRPKAGLLVDRARVVGNLGFRVWRDMRSVVSFSPVVLDPNTAHGNVLLSEDLRGLRSQGFTETRQKVPDNPERFTRYSTVLGSEGFSSGTHLWDVEVGDHSGWIIGVCRESVDRRDYATTTPREGVWVFSHGLDNYFNGCGRKVPVQTRPQRLRVKLDYDRGKVSFYDADHMTHIYTHSDRFTERLFPFFCLNNLKPDSTEIRILPCEPDKGDVAGIKTPPQTKLLSVFKSVTEMFRN